MRMYDIIQKKRDGGVLSQEEIKYFIDGFTAGKIPDYQISALMMAIYFQGMTAEETAQLTMCMAESGDQLDLSRFGNLSVDKHSTGGVGDKTSMIVAPIVAALGAKVTKMSGRGLGHTGGTIDKLESISGYDTALATSDFLRQVEKIGIAVVGQSGNLTPADKKLYALRDVTATVNSIPLITSSIMSKKLAAGSHNIVLDVKFGSGAFMKTPEQAQVLAESMVEIGRKCGRNVSAVLTGMDEPLGNAIGNSLEVKEAICVLTGEKTGDLYDVCVMLASQMIMLVYGVSFDEAKMQVIDTIRSKKAFNKFKEWIAAQGGDVACLDDPDLFKTAANQWDVCAETEGYITKMDAEKIGLVSVALGAGRATKEDTIDHAAGIVLHKKIGEHVKIGETICTLHTNRADVLEVCDIKMKEALSIEDHRPTKQKLIYKVI